MRKPTRHAESSIAIWLASFSTSGHLTGQKVWHSVEASQRKTVEELRIERLLTQAGITFQKNVYVCCRELGGSFRFVDFVIHINGGVTYLEIGMQVNDL